MRRLILFASLVAIVASSPRSTVQGPQATIPGSPSTVQGPPSAESDQAVPRKPSPEQRRAPRRTAPPPRRLPPSYYVPPPRYYFPPISLQRGHYYHPYFGFYFGPYYGPYYPYPGPYAGRSQYSAAAIRLRVKPVETEVYVNGYFAGLVDDFDGVFQRLYLPAGGQDLELYLDGYRSYRQNIYLQPGDMREIVHQMQPLRSGEVNEPPRAPRAVPEIAAGAAGAADRPASPFGVLAIRVEPADAQIVVDGEVWLAADTENELLIHMTAGWHRLEVRKSGYTSFTTQIQLSEGATTRLNVALVR